MEWSLSHVAYQLAGDAGGVSGSETLPPGPLRDHHVLVHINNTAVVSYINRPKVVCGHALCTGWCTRSLCGPKANSSRWEKFTSLGTSLWEQTLVKAGAEAWGFGECLARLGGPFCNSEDIAMSPLVHSDSYGSPGAGCYGTDLAETSSVCLSPNCSAPRSSGKSALGRGPADASLPRSGRAEDDSRTWFLFSTALLGRFLLGRISSHRQGAPLCTPPRVVEAMGVAPEGAQLIASGLSTKVLRPSFNPELPLRGNCMPWSEDSSLHGAEITSSTQLTARLLQCWSSCRLDLHRVNPLHLEALCGGDFGLPCLF